MYEITGHGSSCSSLHFYELLYMRKLAMTKICLVMMFLPFGQVLVNLTCPKTSLVGAGAKNTDSSSYETDVFHWAHALHNLHEFHFSFEDFQFLFLFVPRPLTWLETRPTSAAPNQATSRPKWLHNHRGCVLNHKSHRGREFQSTSLFGFILIKEPGV